MRLRNIPEAKDIVKNSPATVDLPEELGKEGAGDHTIRYPEGDTDAALRADAWSAVCEAVGTKRPIALEIGMGKGTFLLGMAERHPDMSFLGVERYESVLIRAVQRMERLAEPLPNVRFLHTDASLLPMIFPAGSVNALYLNFSDPWPKTRHARRRLTSPEFLRSYETYLARGSVLTFKTDNTGLFDYSEETMMAQLGWEILDVTRDLHRELAEGEENIQTEYEIKFSALGSRICRMRAVWRGAD